MENSIKILIFLVVLAFGLTEYNIIVNNVSTHDAYLKFGEMVGIIGILYLGYTSTKKSNEKKVEENQPKN
jgi:hypothetical protein